MATISEPDRPAAFLFRDFRVEVLRAADALRAGGANRSAVANLFRHSGITTALELFGAEPSGDPVHDAQTAVGLQIERLTMQGFIDPARAMRPILEEIRSFTRTIVPLNDPATVRIRTAESVLATFDGNAEAAIHLATDALRHVPRFEASPVVYMALQQVGNAHALAGNKAEATDAWNSARVIERQLQQGLVRVPRVPTPPAVAAFDLGPRPPSDIGPRPPSDIGHVI